MEPGDAEHRPADSFDEDSVALLRRFREEGDRSALGVLLQRNAARVERIVRIRLGRALAARVELSDVVQQTMLQALESLHRFEPREDARLIHWLARIAEREVARLVKRERAQMREVEREVPLDRPSTELGNSAWLMQLPAESTAVPERVSRREMEGIVDACLSELPEALRESVILREYAGGSWEFVAERLKRPSADAARKLYARAREALGECVQRRVGKGGEDE